MITMNSTTPSPPSRSSPTPPKSTSTAASYTLPWANMSPPYVAFCPLATHLTAQVSCYIDAIKADKYLAVAYFQQGVSNFLMGDFEEALANFNDTLLYLRGNKYIDYEQVWLKF